jgi:hypothetical protein
MRLLSRIAPAIFLALLIMLQPSAAQDGPAPATLPPQVIELLDLLRDPAVAAWIEAQGDAGGRAVAQAATPAAATPSAYLAARLVAVRQHLLDLATAIPDLPRQLQDAGTTLAAEIEHRGSGHLLFLIFLFVALGLAAEGLFRRLTADIAQWILNLQQQTVGQRLIAAGMRLGYGMVMILAFAAGSIGTFLVNDWPLLSREIVLGYLLAFLALRTSRLVGRFLLWPDDERFRLLPLDAAAARFWHRRLGLVAGWFAFGWVTVDLLATLGLAMAVRHQSI